MQLGDLPLAGGLDRHPVELQPLVNRNDVGLVAAEPVKRLGDDDFEAAVLCIAKQLLIPLRMRLAPETARSE